MCSATIQYIQILQASRMMCPHGFVKPSNETLLGHDSYTYCTCGGKCLASDTRLLQENGSFVKPCNESLLGCHPVKLPPTVSRVCQRFKMLLLWKVGTCNVQHSLFKGVGPRPININIQKMQQPAWRHRLAWWTLLLLRQLSKVILGAMYQIDYCNFAQQDLPHDASHKLLPNVSRVCQSCKMLCQWKMGICKMQRFFVSGYWF